MKIIKTDKMTQQITEKRKVRSVYLKKKDIFLVVSLVVNFFLKPNFEDISFYSFISQ